MANEKVTSLLKILKGNRDSPHGRHALIVFVILITQLLSLLGIDWAMFDFTV